MRVEDEVCRGRTSKGPRRPEGLFFFLRVEWEVREMWKEEDDIVCGACAHSTLSRNCFFSNQAFDALRISYL